MSKKTNVLRTKSGGLHAEVEDRFGVLPNFFRLAPEAPEITTNLWGFAKFGYLDNPLPPLFKERLFVYLSRFCEVRYCIARHVGFLVGLGRPAGDRLCSPEAIEQVVRLIRRPLPRDDALEPHLAALEGQGTPLPSMPVSDGPGEEAVFACATHVFLQTPQAPRCLEALRRAFGETMFQHLTVFLAFVRTAHYWTQVHPELGFEDDVQALLAVHEVLADCVLNDPEAATCQTSQELLDELALLRKEHGLRKEMEEATNALRASEGRFREMIDALPAAIYTTDAEGRLTHFNPAAVELSGRVPELGTDRWCVSCKLYHPDGTPLPHDECPMAIALKEGHALCGAEAIAERPDGTRISFAAYPSPLRDDKGKIVGGINMLIDVTERKQAEAALREADRRKDEFLAMLAHELRNPLAPIRNAVQFLRRTDGDGQAVQSASEILERQVGQMVRLIDDLLNVSRIRRGKIELRKERVALVSVVNQAVEAIRPLCDSMDHVLTVSLPPQPVYLEGDSARLAQVMGNLLNNACKFTDKGGRIWLTVEQEGEQVIIRVRDTGIGIDADQLSSVFEEFTQLDTSLERSQSGLGIGLTLVKNLVEMHGGTVEAHSDGKDRGSEFVVCLPILMDTPEPPVLESTTSEPTMTAGRRILVVDDNRDSATALAMLLGLTGNRTQTAHDGLQAVEAAAAFKPDVILLDIGLPKMNGYDVARRVREQPWGEKTVIVALTGWGQDEDRRKSREAGFDSHMVKPVDYAALTRLLAELGTT